MGGSARCQIFRLSPHGPAELVHELTGLVTIANSVCFYRYNGQLRLIVNHNEPLESMMGTLLCSGALQVDEDILHRHAPTYTQVQA